MKIFIVDITSRNAVQYNPSLCRALSETDSSNQVLLLSPKLSEKPVSYKHCKLFSFIPDKWELSTGWFKRAIRAFEVLLNYIYVGIQIFIKRPDVVHIQWLPFLEFSSIEVYVLLLYRIFKPNIKIAFTAHNIYPHNISDINKGKYKTRFVEISKYINVFIVHLNSAKVLLSSEFGIQKEKIFVSYHGIYLGKVFEPNNDNTTIDQRKKVILYGYQSKYKGADIVVSAYNLLSPHEQAQMSITIVGKTDDTLYKDCGEMANRLGIRWINRFVPDDELYYLISMSDLILLPYREISQSGVLLLALSYKKTILTSDLPSFIETLDGYPRDYFFKTGDPESLAQLLSKYLMGIVDDRTQINVIENLNKKYSWTETAKSTMAAYEFAIQRNNK